MQPYKPNHTTRRECPCQALLRRLHHHLRHLRHHLTSHYRLTVYYHGQSQPVHTYSSRLRPLRRQIATLHGTACWMLYRQGPIGLPEREIDYGTYLQ